MSTLSLSHMAGRSTVRPGMFTPMVRVSSLQYTVYIVTCYALLRPLVNMCSTYSRTISLQLLYQYSSTVLHNTITMRTLLVAEHALVLDPAGDLAVRVALALHHHLQYSSAQYIPYII